MVLTMLAAAVSSSDYFLPCFGRFTFPCWSRLESKWAKIVMYARLSHCESLEHGVAVSPLP